MLRLPYAEFCSKELYCCFYARQEQRRDQLFTYAIGLILLTTVDPDGGSIWTGSTEFGGDSEAQEIIFYWA